MAVAVGDCQLHVIESDGWNSTGVVTVGGCQLHIGGWMAVTQHTGAMVSWRLPVAHWSWMAVTQHWGNGSQEVASGTLELDNWYTALEQCQLEVAGCMLELDDWQLEDA